MEPSTITAKDMSNDSVENSATPYSVDYALNAISHDDKSDMENLMDKRKKMVLRCKSCGKEFDSTFSVEEFSMISEEQRDAGTLHLCPSCGNLSIYELKDYFEPQ